MLPITPPPPSARPHTWTDQPSTPFIPHAMPINHHSPLPQLTTLQPSAPSAPHLNMHIIFSNLNRLHEDQQPINPTTQQAQFPSSNPLQDTHTLPAHKAITTCLHATSLNQSTKPNQARPDRPNRRLNHGTKSNRIVPSRRTERKTKRSEARNVVRTFDEAGGWWRRLG